MDRDSVANRLYYIPPPDQVARVHGSGESIHYIALATGAGPGMSSIDPKNDFAAAEQLPRAGKKAPDTTLTTSGNTEAKSDSVFTVLEVDSAVTRSQNSAAPAYPLDLLKKNVEGSVVARYVVDTTGFADTTSLVVLKATDPEFADAVREALPYMRFSPAKMGGHKVRQLVEQGFGFRIAPAVAAIPRAQQPKP
jgi:outer membrane biosynthesis protein TonB